MPAWTHVTVPTPPNRRRSASAYAINADNAAEVALSVGLGQTTTASGASRITSAVNHWPIRDDDPANTRNQPRTVLAGRPSHAAIFRCP